jgi:hypothetical protein
VLGGFTIFQRTTCSGYLKYQHKRTGWFWVFEKDQNQRTTGILQPSKNHGFFAVL